MSPVDLQALHRLRVFLQPKWIEWGLQYNRPTDEHGRQMCRFTSAVLLRVLGREWRLVGGAPAWDWEATDRRKPGGFWDGRRWHPHHWVTNGHVIVDLTATQFDPRLDPVLVVDVDDPRYGRTFLSSLAIREALLSVEPRARLWHEEWMAQEVLTLSTSQLHPQSSSNTSIFTERTLNHEQEICL